MSAYSIDSSTIDPVYYSGIGIPIGITDPLNSNISANALHAKGDVTVEGNLTVSGTLSSSTIESRLDAIESRLAILRPDPDLESRWEELKQAREHYVRLEAEFHSYERVIDILKT